MTYVLGSILMACGGGGGGGTDTGPTAASWPADSSEAGIAAFVASDAWREAPWVAETDAPRERTSDVSPHGRVRVWANDVLIASQAAGNGEMGGPPHDPGSMVVKELYDAADAPIGVAVMLLPAAGAEWVYYCDGPAASCGVGGETPVWGEGLDTDCGFCHGGLVFNEW